MVFIGMVWMAVMPRMSNASMTQSAMEVVARQVVMTISVFQFIAAQLLAVIMLSNAVSDEVYHRTLGLLMTTPINGLQIVMGKLLSKLLQLVLLLAISLPVLAIVRVFGGISWDYLLSSLLITLTAAIFAGSLTLLLSIQARRSYVVIIRSAFVLGVLYLFVPMMAVAVGEFVLPQLGIHIHPGSALFRTVAFVLTHANPFGAMLETTRAVTFPGHRTGLAWPLHCAVMLGLSAFLIAWAVTIVRRVALWQATGQLIERETGLATAGADAGGSPVKGRGLSVGRVQGPPVIWRELRSPFIRGVDGRNSRIGLAITILMLLLTYLASHLQGFLHRDFVHVSYGLLFVFLGLAVNGIFAATRITAEKESQTWSLLLVTPLSDYDILMGKAVSAFRRCLPIWGLLAGHVMLFVAVGYIHPAAVFHLLIIVIWTTCFVTGAGLYFSACFHRTTTAVVATFSLMLGLWAIGPILAGILSVAVKSEAVFATSMTINPMVQTELTMAGAAGRDNAGSSLSSLEYGAEHVIFRGAHGVLGFGRMTTVLLVTSGGYMLAGLLFFWLAKRRLRRNVFGPA